MDAFTSSEVIVRPVWNFTPERSVNVQVSPSEDDRHDVASSGFTCCVVESYRVSCSYMLFIAMTSFESPVAGSQPIITCEVTSEVQVDPAPALGELLPVLVPWHATARTPSTIAIAAIRRPPRCTPMSTSFARLTRREVPRPWPESEPRG